LLEFSEGFVSANELQIRVFRLDLIELAGKMGEQNKKFDYPDNE
jgi:hypothetical protein